MRSLDEKSQTGPETPIKIIKETKEVKVVQNVALAEATAQAKPSPWTKSMFMVCAA